jgi:hypothetical protein
MDLSRHLLREALLSAIINACISVGFFVAFFRGVDPIPVWGVGNYAADFMPQSFAVTLMSALVPGFLNRRALAAGRFSAHSVPSTARVIASALAWAVGGLVIGSGGAALALWLSGADAIDATSAFVIKIGYGAALGAFVTYRAVARMIDEAR